MQSMVMCFDRLQNKLQFQKGPLLSFGQYNFWEERFIRVCRRSTQDQDFVPLSPPQPEGTPL